VNFARQGFNCILETLEQLICVYLRHAHVFGGAWRGIGKWGAVGAKFSEDAITAAGHSFMLGVASL
jgi:hypothetical protein